MRCHTPALSPPLDAAGYTSHTWPRNKRSPAGYDFDQAAFSEFSYRFPDRRSTDAVFGYEAPFRGQSVARSEFSRDDAALKGRSEVRSCYGPTGHTESIAGTTRGVKREWANRLIKPTSEKHTETLTIELGRPEVLRLHVYTFDQSEVTEPQRTDAPELPVQGSSQSAPNAMVESVERTWAAKSKHGRVSGAKEAA